MNNKINCTCGWSWNKSDSSKKDMYICHECGRDNSNNMKNGGWLDSIPQAQDGEEIGNLTQEGIDIVQSIYRNNPPSTILGNLPFNLGAGIGLLQSHINNEPEKLSDQLGVFPNPYAQIASYVALFAEAEKEGKEKFAKNKNKGRDITKLVPEKEVNKKVIDNTYVPKPKIGKLKDTKKETKPEQISYKEKKEVNKVEIDNTHTNKPRVDNNYKPKPEIKYKFTTPNISYIDDSFVMPNEVNDVKIDNTYVPKPKYSSNLRNGGWLDNYNDSEVSLPEGYVGEGYNTKGRDYSPAWGGQFQEGGEISNAQKGKKVKYVESKNDPRYKAYQDSLNSYNTGNKVLNKLKTILENNQKSISGYENENNNYAYATTDYIKQPYKKPEYGSNKKGTSPKGQGKDLEKWIKKELDPVNWKSQLPIAEVLKELDKNKVLPFRSISSAEIPTISIYKKPEEEIIVQRPQEQIIQNLQPIGIQNDFNIEAALPQIRQQVRQPKYYDIEDYTQGSTNYNGTQSNYRTSDLSTLSQQTPNNTRKITPQYQMGGSLPGSVGSMYARTGSIPSNGKYAKKTKASAKYGDVIKDDMGQWKYPGQITEIGSNQITMQGVPYPVLGISDTGDTQMMYPEEEYEFDGSKVTEFPMAQGGTSVKSTKNKNLINLTDLTYTPEELTYINDINNGYCPGGNCLESSRKAYDMTAGKIQGFPSSNDIWTNDLKLISTPDRPSEELVKQHPYFRGDTKFGSADSWDIHGAIVKAGGKNIYSQAKGQAIPTDIPVGAVAGWGPSKTRKTNYNDRGKGMNIDYGLQPSHHSTESVGYNDKGEPIFYDSYARKYGTIEEIKEGLSLLGYELENVSVPKSVAANTRENINKKGLLKNDLTPYSTDINKLISATSQPWAQINEDGKMRSAKPDKEKLTKFAQALIDNKGELVSSLGLSNAEYDRLADTALAISMAESEGGGALNFIDNFGSTQGMTQLNAKNIKNDNRLKSARSKKYKTNSSVLNLQDPYNSAIATMMYLSVADKDAKRLYDKGLKSGERSFTESGLLSKFRSSNSRINNDGVYIEELNKRVPFSKIPGYKDKDLTKINTYLKNITKSDKYKFVENDGELTLKMKTKGNNPKLTDIEKIGYMWQSPNSLKTGDAQGDSQYVTRIKNYYQALQPKKRNGGNINKQDEKTLEHLDQLTNFTNYNKPTIGGWLNKYN
jgi:hypothetical protein